MIRVALPITESLRNKYPCNPADNAITPIDAVVIALRVTISGISGSVPISKIGLFKKKKGRMKPVSPNFTAMRLVFV